MSEATEHRVRLHGRTGPPPWQKRSRWFPHMDAGDSLVMSSVLVVILVGGCLTGLLGSVSSGPHVRYDTFSIAATDIGAELIDMSATASPPESNKVIGSLVCGTRLLRHGYFGPAAVTERRLPIAWIRLFDGRTLTSEQIETLTVSAANLTSRFTPTTHIGIDVSDPGHIEIEYAPGPGSIVWSGVAANIGVWLYMAAVGWTIGWFAHSLHHFRDPRRQRARRLGVHLCPRCDYDVRLIESPRCPECGERLTIEPERRS